MVSKIFTGGAIELVENNEGNLIFKKSKSNHSDEQKESNTTNMPEIENEESAEQLDTTDMPELESDKFAAQRRNKQGKGLKILTPNQMLSRLSISLAQLKAGKNSEKFKNEIKQNKSIKV